MKNSKFIIDKLGKLFEQGIISSKDLSSELFNILKSKRVENLENKIRKLELKKKAKRVKRS